MGLATFNWPNQIYHISQIKCVSLHLWAWFFILVWRSVFFSNPSSLFSPLLNITTVIIVKNRIVQLTSNSCLVCYIQFCTNCERHKPIFLLLTMSGQVFLAFGSRTILNSKCGSSRIRKIKMALCTQIPYWHKPGHDNEILANNLTYVLSISLVSF